MVYESSTFQEKLLLTLCLSTFRPRVGWDLNKISCPLRIWGLKKHLQIICSGKKGAWIPYIPLVSCTFSTHSGIPMVTFPGFFHTTHSWYRPKTLVPYLAAGVAGRGAKLRRGTVAQGEAQRETSAFASAIGVDIRWMEEILHHLGWLKPRNNGINHLPTGVGFLPSTVTNSDGRKKTSKPYGFRIPDENGWP